MGGASGKGECMQSASLDQHIQLTPGICGGRPRIAGRRITVQNIVGWHEHEGISADRIAASYELSLAEVHAALAYYFDHRQEIDTVIAADIALERELLKKDPSRISGSTPHLPDPPANGDIL